ncbi:NAD(P)H-binding protein [Marinifilum caeruleilacunae]|uniref:NAD(P)-binding domain-containing protein n=1 Tax=Marinifilum caeruleilacunae TaxID=2499076 RepID=A0ABX1WR18_9BACT|nr:NAD(P)H-binding protein [Marinifilum caeruleilacunae]NOU58530.1 hypothetical protein [Marinifilum caeruleilacunae]
MKNVIITGASGMTGGIVLEHCLESSEIDKVTSFVRKPSGIKHPKLKEIVLSNFLDYSEYVEEFKNVHAVYFCIGVYTGAVPDQIFREITVDYSNEFVDNLKAHSSNANFCFLSGGGADNSEKSRMSFARYKGMAENYMFANLNNAYTFRPGYIYPVKKRKEPNFSYRISRRLYPLIKLFGKNASIKSTELAYAMFKAGLRGTPKKVLENRDILQFIESV